MVLEVFSTCTTSIAVELEGKVVATIRGRFEEVCQRITMAISFSESCKFGEVEFTFSNRGDFTLKIQGKAVCNLKTSYLTEALTREKFLSVHNGELSINGIGYGYFEDTEEFLEDLANMLNSRKGVTYLQNDEEVYEFLYDAELALVKVREMTYNTHIESITEMVLKLAGYHKTGE